MLDRREFLTGIAGVTVTLIVTACGDDDSNGNPGGGGDGDEQQTYPPDADHLLAP